ncbi:hypothetical protein BDZ89DRAFT_1070470 [Hymenopellis radicata]|nr:hypothetical protein BDZ89DRAFT_1070470 [Hymenopellis radicata]
MYKTSAELLVMMSRLERSQALNARLDVEGLKRALSRATGFHCSGLTLKAEGGFHRIYFAHCDGGRDFVARVAFDMVVYRGMKKMESEVATIAWLAKNTDIPVPTIIYYDPTTENEAHAPFMIMEKVRDMTLDKRWQTMSLDDKRVAIKSLAKIVVSLAQTQFDRIGSLYPHDSGGPVIGPMLPPCVPWFFTPDISLDAGPWRSEREYLLSCIARERACTLSHQSELQDKWRNEDLTAIGWDSILAGYLSAYDKLAQVVSSLPALDEPLPDSFGPFVLSHPDLNDRNIMISADDPSQLTLLDWDFASITPLWNLTSTPEFLFYESAGPSAGELPELRALFSAECETHFPDHILWRSQCNKGALMFLLERSCQAISLKVSPETMGGMLDRVLLKTRA